MRPDDLYTMELELCGADGMVDGEYVAVLNRLRRLSGHAPYDGAPFVCTGSAHLAGEHIHCTSPAHALPVRIDREHVSLSLPLPHVLGPESAVGRPLNGWQVTT